MNLIKIGPHTINLDFVARITERPGEPEGGSGPTSWVEVEMASGAVTTLRGREAEDFAAFIAEIARTLDGGKDRGAQNPAPTAPLGDESTRPGGNHLGGRRDYAGDPQSLRRQADRADEGGG